MSIGRRVLLLVAVWSVPAWLTIAESRTLARLAGSPASPPWSSFLMLVQWYVWVPLTPAIVWLGARRPLLRWPPRLSSIAVHALGSLSTAAIVAVVLMAMRMVLGLVRPAPAAILWLSALRSGIAMTPVNAITYTAILAAGSALEFARRLGEREVAQARLNEQLTRAQLDAIRARIHPHFLFNALHSVGALVRTGERDDAVRIVSNLSELLREALGQEKRDLVPLSVELGFVARYLEIESIRFSDRLRVTWSIDDAVTNADIPPLLVQALVENAVRHGISVSGSAGSVGISAQRIADVVEIRVSDDGPGPQSGGARSSGGFGIDAAQQRLRTLLGEDAGMTVGPGPTGGTLARVRIPLHGPRIIA